VKLPDQSRAIKIDTVEASLDKTQTRNRIQVMEMKKKINMMMMILKIHWMMLIQRLEVDIRLGQKLKIRKMISLYIVLEIELRKKRKENME
jgi:hypothetical protein